MCHTSHVLMHAFLGLKGARAWPVTCRSRRGTGEGKSCDATWFTICTTPHGTTRHQLQHLEEGAAIGDAWRLASRPGQIGIKLRVDARST